MHIPLPAARPRIARVDAHNHTRYRHSHRPQCAHPGHSVTLAKGPWRTLATGSPNSTARTPHRGRSRHLIAVKRVRSQCHRHRTPRCRPRPKRFKSRGRVLRDLPPRTPPRRYVHAPANTRPILITPQSPLCHPAPQAHAVHRPPACGHGDRPRHVHGWTKLTSGRTRSARQDGRRACGHGGRPRHVHGWTMLVSGRTRAPARTGADTWPNGRSRRDPLSGSWCLLHIHLVLLHLRLLLPHLRLLLHHLRLLLPLELLLPREPHLLAANAPGMVGAK